MGKRRGEDAGIDVQASKETFMAQAEREEKSSGAPRVTKVQATKRRQRYRPKRANAAPAASNPFKGIVLKAGAAAASSKPAAPVASSAPMGGANASKDHHNQVAALNMSFSAWIQKQNTNKSSSSWVTGVTEYLKYANDLKNAKDNSPAPSIGVFASKPSAPAPMFQSSPSTTTQQPSTLGGSDSATKPSLFGNSAATPPTSLFGDKSAAPSTSLFGDSSKPAAAATSLFGDSSKPTAPSTSLFGDNNSKPSTSLFGDNNNQPSTSLFGDSSKPSTSLFGDNNSKPSTSLFGDSNTGAAPPTSLFGGSTPSLFGKSAPAPVATPAAEEEETEEAEPTVEAKKADDSEEETLFETRAKVMWLKDKAWAKSGVGRFVVLKHKETGAARLLLRAEATGKPFFNAPMFPGMKVEHDKKEGFVDLYTVNYKDVDGVLVGDNDGKVSLYKVKAKKDIVSTLYEKIKAAVPEAK